MVNIDLSLHISHSSAMPKRLEVIPSTSSTANNAPSPVKARSAIYCIDAHPSGKRFATGGGDNKLKIWSTLNLFAKPPPQSPSSPPRSASTPPPSTPSSLLATLCHHGGSVMACRWSTNGRYLASGSDDNLVILYELRPSSDPQNSSMNMQMGQTPQTPNVENWSRCRILRAHNLDVVDLSWCPPYNEFIASCSLDQASPVCVWKLDLVGAGISDAPPPCSSFSSSSSSNSNSKSNSNPPPTTTTTTTTMMTSPHKILGLSPIHTSFVKGLTFDPSGKFLATSSDDPSICLWETTSWSLLKKIDSSHPMSIFNSLDDGYSELVSQCLFRRIDWGPDGNKVSSTNGSLKNKPVVSLIQRKEEGEEWGETNSASQNCINLVGHKDAVCASRFNSLLFRQKNSNSNSNSNNNTNTNSNSNNGDYTTILACGDKLGFLTVWVSGTPKPLFKCQVSPSKSMITDISWGGGIGNSNTPATGGRTLFVTTLDGFVTSIDFTDLELGVALPRAERNDVLRQKYGDAFWEGVVTGSNTAATSSSSNLIESSLELGFMSDNSNSQNSQQQQTVSNSFSRPTSTSSSTATATATATATTTATTFNLASPTKTPQETRNAQVVTKNAKGKKRIAPVLVQVQNGNAGIDIMRQECGDDAMIVDDGGSARGNETSNINGNSKKPRIESPNAAPKGLARDLATAKTILAQQPVTHKQLHPNFNPQQGLAAPQTQKNITTIVHEQQFNSNIIQPPIQNTLKTFFSDGVVAVATHTTCLPSQHASNSKTSSQSTISVSNENNNGHENSATKWSDVITGRASAITGQAELLAVGTTNGEIHLWERYGPNETHNHMCRKKFAPMILPGGVCALAISPQQQLFVVCADASFFVFDLEAMKLKLKGSIVGPLRSMITGSKAPPTLVKATLNDKNQIIIVLNKYGAVGGGLQAFIYDENLEIFLRVADGRFAHSNLFSALALRERVGIGGEQNSELAKLESVVARGVSSNTALVIDGNGADTDFLTQKHCEDRVCAARAMQCEGDICKWTLELVKLLSGAGDEKGLRDVFSRALDEEMTSLAKDFLLVIAKNRTLSGLTGELASYLT